MSLITSMPKRRNDGEASAACTMPARLLGNCSNQSGCSACHRCRTAQSSFSTA